MSRPPSGGGPAKTRGRGRPAARAALPALMVLLVAVPFIAMGLDGFRVPPKSLAAARTLGLVAITVLFINLCIGAFRPLIARAYKPRPLQSFHQGIDLAAFVLALAHGLVMIGVGIRGYQWQVWLGPIVLVLLAVVIVTAFRRAHLRHAWRWLHRFNYALLILVVAHAFVLGYSLILQPFMRVIFLVYVAVAAIGLGYRVYQLLRPPRSPARPAAKR